MGQLYQLWSGQSVKQKHHKMVGRIVLVFLVFGAASIKADLTADQRNMLMAIHKVCAATTGVTDEQFEAHMNGQITEDDQTKEHALCFAKALNIMTPDGKLKPEVIKAKIVPVVGEAKADEIIAKCAKDMATPQDTALAVGKCLQNEHH